MLRYIEKFPLPKNLNLGELRIQLQNFWKPKYPGVKPEHAEKIHDATVRQEPVLKIPIAFTVEIPANLLLDKNISIEITRATEAYHRLIEYSIVRHIAEQHRDLITLSNRYHELGCKLYGMAHWCEIKKGWVPTKDFNYLWAVNIVRDRKIIRTHFKSTEGSEEDDEYLKLLELLQSR